MILVFDRITGYVPSRRPLMNLKIGEEPFVCGDCFRLGLDLDTLASH